MCVCVQALESHRIAQSLELRTTAEERGREPSRERIRERLEEKEKTAQQLKR